MSTGLSEAARTLLAEPRIAHVVTLAADGSAQVSGVWVALEGEDVVFFTQRQNAKVRNLERDPRISMSIEGDPGGFLQPYLVLHGTAVVEECGPEAWMAAMDRLAEQYVGGPFPNRAGGAGGVRVRTQIERVGGVGI